MSDLALNLVGLCAGYGTRRLVEHLSLSVRAGETVRLAGANGAGKSTVLRTIVGRQPALSGEVWIAGVRLDARLPDAKRHLGYAGDEGLAFPYLTVHEHLRLIGRVHGLGAARVDALLADLEGTSLPAHRDVLVRRCSRGTRRQLDLAAATMHAPRLVVLDEALDGLDELTTGVWVRRLHGAVEAGASLVVTSHSPAHVNQLRPDAVVDLSDRDLTPMGVLS